ncbi:Uncharacterized protein FKW44_004033 [Caligus rogercresseyi]|uniref:Uncharacterized protein n=1 Tax=Caligus rogercresseyi TaxID=217165 RepID=A0A7T8HL66_CALRO|nr:Uncharacterized protein FKW44_004033 [Caligus rogercresseyi]
MEIDNKGIDYIFSDIVGGNGPAQWKIVFFGFFLNAAGGVPLFIHMFAAFTPSHRCKVPACESQPGDEWMTWALPDSQGSSNFLQEDGQYDSCSSYRMKDSSGECTPDNFSNETMLCSEWVYDKSDYQETIATKYNLVCDSEYKQKLLGTMIMVGLMFGSILGGRAGDYLGRKVSCYSSISITTCLLFISGVIPSYEFYAAFILLMCTCLPIHWICAHNILVEAFGVEGREKCIAIKDTFAPMYTAILGGLAYFFRPYAHLHFANGTLGLIALSTAFFIPESVRWDCVNANWITVTFGAYTLALNITNLSGDIFLNFIISGLAELPASLVIYVLLKYTSRRFNLFFYQFITSSCCVALALIPKSWSVTVLIIFLIGLSSSGAGFVMVWLLPSTGSRNMFHACKALQYWCRISFSALILLEAITASHHRNPRIPCRKRREKISMNSTGIKIIIILEAKATS